jgi:hypothetical protein
MSIRNILLSYGNAQAAAAPPVLDAQVQNKTVADSGLDSSNASIWHWANGTCQVFGTTGASSYAWRLAGASADYQLRATFTSGTTVPTFSAGWANNTWIGMATDRSYSIDQQNAGTLDATLTVEIRYTSNSVLIATGTHTMSATAEK